MNNLKIVRTNRKSIALEIQSDGTLLVRSPLGVPDSLINNLLDKKKKWINEKQRLIQERKIKALPKQYKEGEEFYYLGKKFVLKFSDNVSLPIQLDNAFIIHSQYSSHAEKLLKFWYKQQAKKIIPPCVKQIAGQYNLEYKSVKITSAEKRWGSCTSKKTLNFTWRIIMLPSDIIEYIVIHELAHLKQLNHSKKFWNEVETILPDYRVREKWLTEHSYKFKIY